MAVASRVVIEIDSASVPLLPGALAYSRQGALAGGLKNNREFAFGAVEKTREIPVELENLLYDPQTSGGLLIALPEADATQLIQKLEGARRIGRVLPAGGKSIRLL
jgi:selenide,water dikinase